MKNRKQLLSGILIGIFVLVACRPPALKSPESEAATKNDTANVAVDSTDSAEFKIPIPERWEYDNGLVVFHEYDEELPLVEITLFVPAGSLLDPPGQGGVAYATAYLMKSGGTKNLSPKVVDEKLNDLGASITTTFHRDYGELKLSCLADELEEVLPIFYEIVAEPRFDADRLGLWKHLAVGSILRRSEDVPQVAQMVFESAVFGPDSAFARQMTLESADRITRKDIASWHKRYVRPSGAHLAVTGAVAPEELKKVLHVSFEGWRNSSNKPVDWPKQTIKPKSAVYVVSRDTDIAQILIGHVGPRRMTSDHYLLEVLNRMFGMEGYDSTLSRRIASMSNVYSATGGIEGGASVGVFKVDIKADASAVSSVLVRARQLVKETAHKAYSQGQIHHTVKDTERKFMSKFSNTAEIVRRAANLEHLGFSSTYEQNYIKNLSQVSTSSIQQAARRHIKVNDMVYVVVGNVQTADIKSVLGDEIPVYNVRFEETPIFPTDVNFVK